MNNFNKLLASGFVLAMVATPIIGFAYYGMSMEDYAERAIYKFRSAGGTIGPTDTVVKDVVDFAERVKMWNIGWERGYHAPKGLFAVFLSLWFLFKFLALFVSALAVGLVFKKYSKEILDISFRNPWKELGRGFVIAVVWPVASFLILFTFVGAPIGVAAFLSYGAIMVFAWILSAILLGSALKRWIKKENTHEISWKTILLGAFVFKLLSFVPIVGWILQCGIVLTALGATMKLKWNLVKEWR